jgi:hypothetical protein
MPNLAAQRGGSDLLKSIREGAKKVSESREMQSTMDSLRFDRPSASRQTSIPEGGAAASLQRMTSTPSPVYTPSTSASKTSSPLLENYSEKAFINHLLESVSTLGSTKEYFGAINSLFTLYAMDKLSEGVLDSISRGDLREIKSIIKDFSNVLDSY